MHFLKSLLIMSSLLFFISTAQSAGMHKSDDSKKSKKEALGKAKEPEKTLTPKEQLQQRKDNLRDLCISNTFEMKECVYRENDYSYKPSTVRKILTKPTSAVANAAGTAISRLWQYENGIWDPEDKNYEDQKAAATYYDQTKVLLANKLGREDLTSCQKACLALCFTSQIISYKDNDIAGYQSTQLSVERGEGVCRDYSEIALKYLEQVGVDSRIVYGAKVSRSAAGEITEKAGHAWVAVKIDGKEYFVEPQSPVCNFYPSTYKDEAKKPIESYLQDTKFDAKAYLAKQKAKSKK